MESQYFKFKIPYGSIHNILSNYQQVIFYVDIYSIARGFYNVNVVEMELSEYVTNMQQNNNKLPFRFIEEAKNFYNKLFKEFKQYNPKFITFFDNGNCLQNKNLLPAYKDSSSSRGLASFITEDWKIDLMHQIKKYYFSIFPEHFSIQNLSACINLEDYESDLIPYYLIKNNILNSQHPKVLNVILSTDKDLLQTCRFLNTIQIISLYKKKDRKIEFNIFNNDTGIGYIYKNFKRGILTCEYIPLILAISGDKADHISGVSGIGPSKACKLIETYKLPPQIDKQTNLPDEIKSWKDKIINNYKLISFDEQIKRIPSHKLSLIDENTNVIKGEN